MGGSPLASPRPLAPAPDDLSLLLTLFQQARHAEAEQLARGMTVRFPRHPLAWKVLAAALAAQNRTQDAIRVYQRAAPLLASDPEFHNNFANALKLSGRPAEAETHYRKALALSPDYAEAHGNLGLLLHTIDRPNEAKASFRRALSLRPDSASIQRNLADLLHAIGRMDEAEAAYRIALAQEPQAETYNGFGTLQYKLCRYGEARESYARAIALRPDYAEAHANLGLLEKATSNFDAAEAHLRHALHLAPDHPGAANTMGVLLQESGELDEAEARFRSALPQSAVAHSNLLFLLQHVPDFDPAALREEHRAFALRWERPLRKEWAGHGNSRDADRVLRIGFISGDLRDHPVERYLLPVLEILREHPGLSLHAYSNSFAEDGRTADYRICFRTWRAVAALSDAALSAQIRSDAIDILFDLSGHTGGNRLLTFARKPAPLQISWLGYVGTTGMDAIDYVIADRHLVPVELYAQFSEKIISLPVTAPFRPYPGSPAVGPLPALNDSCFTFGSFNRAGKLNRRVIALWVRILHAVPQARLAIAAIPPGRQAERLTAWFREFGISPERLGFLSSSGMEQALALHNQVDLCLDAFPYNGSTTSNHALWMGVPTLTLLGATAPGRIGAAQAAHAGLGEFVAASPEELVRKAMDWANNRAQLAELRANLRERFAASVQLQTDRFAAAFATALRIAWQRWCAGMKAESFSVDG